ncbi:MAG TPA: VOC family protein [Candidatus Acidoferrum sp.]|nr:VOC family protein [Candidatus Acidoferrum sp.]
MATPKSAPSAGSTIIPGLRYRNATAAIDWLCKAFGFEQHFVVPGENGTIAHAQLTFGSGMIMLGSVREDDHRFSLQQPDQTNGAETQCPYVVVPDCDAHYARAKSSGAQIVFDIHDEGHGGRGYACRDLESHLWYFGSYDPWHT